MISAMNKKDRKKFFNINFMSRLIDNFYWGMVHRFHPKNKYNTIKIRSLKPGYYDPDQRILHGCFDLFCEWFEDENISKNIRDDMSTYSRECVDLYHYWMVIRPKYLDLIDTKLINDATSGKTSMDLHEKLDEIDNKMLIRLIHIRTSIWYL